MPASDGTGRGRRKGRGNGGRVSERRRSVSACAASSALTRGRRKGQGRDNDDPDESSRRRRTTTKRDPQDRGESRTNTKSRNTGAREGRVTYDQMPSARMARTDSKEASADHGPWTRPRAGSEGCARKKSSHFRSTLTIPPRSTSFPRKERF